MPKPPTKAPTKKKPASPEAFFEKPEPDPVEGSFLFGTRGPHEDDVAITIDFRFNPAALGYEHTAALWVSVAQFINATLPSADVEKFQQALEKKSAEIEARKQARQQAE